MEHYTAAFSQELKYPVWFDLSRDTLALGHAGMLSLLHSWSGDPSISTDTQARLQSLAILEGPEATSAQDFAKWPALKKPLMLPVKQQRVRCVACRQLHCLPATVPFEHEKKLLEIYEAKKLNPNTSPTPTVHFLELSDWFKERDWPIAE